MTTTDILRHRLYNQRLNAIKFQNLTEAVAWFGAVQSQDYPNAKWAVGQRVSNATDETLEQAFTDGKILRTHVMRPTWHFVAPQDIRWMLKLTAPRIKAIMRYYSRQVGLDEEVFTHSQKVLTKALQGKKQLTRLELGTKLHEAGISVKTLALGFIASFAELDGVICSGPRKGKQFTYMLLDERAPQAKSLDRDESLAQLAKRYFQSHGPATLQDFVWWSGLTTADAKRGIELNTHFIEEEIDRKKYWFTKALPPPIPQTTYLLPNYDEYTIAYKNREAFWNEEFVKHLDTRANPLFQHMIVMNGRIIGTWKRTLKKDSVIIEFQFFTKPTEKEYKEFKSATDRYAKFFGVTAVLSPIS